ncbi:MAG TPA: SOS response-associated peptidase [Steroidobacteraceae bacterium]|jgi:putative SOS response-associated peptidase YedK|nr:SOS response-associated peptidase [Steroidobacteraceae bacterium]
MCERYVMADAEQAEREFGVVRRWWQFSPSFNVGPSRYVPVIRMHDGQAEGVMLRWGLIPDWAEADAAKACAVTASLAEVEHAAATRGGWELGRRCIVPMFGFYAWQMTWQGHRQPFFVRLVNRQVFGVAAVWDHTEADDGDDVIESCAMITVPPNSLLAELQGSASEMPAILDRRDYAVWLTAAPAVAKTVLQPLPQQHMIAHPVSPRINSFRYDDEHLIRPVGNISHLMSV